tara:strand:+ start:1038 stop:1880 length:843 start_codon:yes stop_codon:yes gene_type:complete
MMLDVRFNILDKFVEKFIVTESKYSHSGDSKPLNFNINNYPRFKDKIIYLVIDKEPEDLLERNKSNENYYKRINSLKRIELSYNYMEEAIKNAAEDDLIILSDNDEIPNLESKVFKKSKRDVFLFKQQIFYYKFNLHYKKMSWYGTKACKKKKLKSFAWLKNLKNKKYPFWRIDTLFSKNKLIDMEIITDGGWHFTNLKTAKDLHKKLSNFGHHDEFDESGLTVADLQKHIDEEIVFYDHSLDKKNENKWKNNYKLTKVETNNLPKYIFDNKEKFKEWLS